ncbi:hypothetical protein LQW54_004224 [Pestalotiopsis sp. IQ-011]
MDPRTQAQLNEATLSRVPERSNMTRYLERSQGFEKRAQGLPAKPRDMSKPLSKWDKKWKEASAGSGSSTT